MMTILNLESFIYAIQIFNDITTNFEAKLSINNSLTQ